MKRIPVIGLIVLTLSLPIPVMALSATPAASPSAASGDFAGLVDIGGGRRLWLECRGHGSPTVMLEAGSGNNADVWDTIALESDSGAMAVLPGIAAFTRVCAYDRPGTMLDADHPSRSDPAPMPRTAADAVADLHALIDGAGIPGPYVLVGHSLGGIIVRLYAATYPHEIAGLVLIDASHEEQYARWEAELGPEQWADLQQQVLSGPDDDPDLERMDFDASFAQLQAAAAAHPLPPLPLVVLTPGVSTNNLAPPEMRAALPPDFPWDALEAVHQELQDELAALAPGARHAIATKSGHYIQLQQPELVIDAIQQVVAAVHDPTAWTAPMAASPSAASGDFAGMVDIGGRNIYLECHGTGSPTVVLVAGGSSSARYWSDDLLHPDAPRSMVLPEVAKFTRVCAYDRPGTYAFINDEIFISRSDAVAQPRTVSEMVDELHALLQAAGIPGPYVLAGHSWGGFMARFYAATYPDEVVGLVLVDAYSELLAEVMSAEKWQALVRLNQDLGSDVVNQIPGYGDAESTGYGANDAVMREAAAASPLPPLPLAVFAHGKPFSQSADAPGFAPGELERYLLAANEAQAALVPNARFTVASESGHDIHQDQPELVIEAIRQVVEGVRNPDTWYDLISCCTD